MNSYASGWSGHWLHITVIVRMQMCSLFSVPLAHERICSTDTECFGLSGGLLSSDSFFFFEHKNWIFPLFAFHFLRTFFGAVWTSGVTEVNVWLSKRNNCANCNCFVVTRLPWCRLGELGACAEYGAIYELTIMNRSNLNSNFFPVFALANIAMALPGT